MIQSALELCTASNVAMSIRTNCRFKISGNNLTLKKGRFLGPFGLRVFLLFLVK